MWLHSSSIGSCIRALLTVQSKGRSTQSDNNNNEFSSFRNVDMPVVDTFSRVEAGMAQNDCHFVLYSHFYRNIFVYKYQVCNDSLHYRQIVVHLVEFKVFYLLQENNSAQNHHILLVWKRFNWIDLYIATKI